MAELKPCPFCGSKKIRIYVYDPFDGYQGNWTVHRVHCKECNAQVQRDKVMDAIEAWNRRYTPSEIDFDYEAED